MAASEASFSTLRISRCPSPSPPSFTVSTLSFSHSMSEIGRKLLALVRISSSMTSIVVALFHVLIDSYMFYETANDLL